MTISPRTSLSRRDRVAISLLAGYLGAIFEIAPRSRLSRHERVWCGEFALRSRCGVDISTRYFEISPRWWLSRRDLADLGAISARLPRSHRGLLFSARYFEISPRSWLSRRDLADLGKIAAISPRSVKFLQGVSPTRFFR